MELNERIARYLEAAPPAVSGQKGHDTTFFIACALCNGFALSESETLYWLQQYNVKCQPPWSDRELEHKVRQAMKASHGKPRGHLLGAGVKVPAYRPPSEPTPFARKNGKVDHAENMRKFLQGFTCTEQDITKSSPIDLGSDEHWNEHGVIAITSLFEKSDMVNVVTAYTDYEKKDKTMKANPSGLGFTMMREDLIEYIDPAFKKFKASAAGAWLRINPVSENGVSDSDVTAFKYALVEFDNVPLDLQIPFLAKVPLPIAAILTSGDKSIHAWVKMDAPDMAAYLAAVDGMRERLSIYGMDKSNRNPSRLSRLPGVERSIKSADGDGRQRLIYLNKNPEQKAIL